MYARAARNAKIAAGKDRKKGAGGDGKVGSRFERSGKGLEKEKKKHGEREGEKNRGNIQNTWVVRWRGREEEKS